MELYPFQDVGVRWLQEQRNRYLGDTMGCGKTVQALVAAERMSLRKLGVVAPAATIPNWNEEAAVWAPSVEVEVHSYASPRLIDVSGTSFDRVVLDEAHYCKSPKARRTKAAHAIASEAGGAWLLSGTPMPNHAGELFTTFNTFWPDLFPDGVSNREYAWLAHFTRFEHTRYGIKVHGNKNAADLLPMLKEIMLRRRLQDVADQLPELRVDLHVLPPFTGWKLDREGAQLLLRMEREADMDEGSLSRLRRLLGSLKAPAIADTIGEELEADQYDQIVVLYHHRDVGDRVQRRLQQYGLVRLDGKSTPKKRAEVLKTFQGGGARVFLGQQTSAGTGLNLQVAHELALLEPSWVPDENKQAIYRIYRLGQTHKCRARVFAVEDTLDHAVNRVLIRKSRDKQELGL
jgi:SNF2 family DNA or RNA helicase